MLITVLASKYISIPLGALIYCNVGRKAHRDASLARSVLRPAMHSWSSNFKSLTYGKRVCPDYRWNRWATDISIDFSAVAMNQTQRRQPLWGAHWTSIIPAGRGSPWTPLSNLDPLSWYLALIHILCCYTGWWASAKHSVRTLCSYVFALENILHALIQSKQKQSNSQLGGFGRCNIVSGRQVCCHTSKPNWQLSLQDQPPSLNCRGTTVSPAACKWYPRQNARGLLG